MSIFDGFIVSGSGMAAQRARLETILGNMANAHTTRTPEGTPYRRKDIVLVSAPTGDFRNQLHGVLVAGRVESGDFLRRYEPGHPDADAEGYVLYPNINPIEEMVNLLGSTRAYESNVAAMSMLRDMMARAIEIGR